MPITIEVCVDSLAGAVLAQSLGADRLELCANLSIGGTTPSAGLLRKVRAAVQIPVHVLVRPRGGDFLYHDAEIETMLAEIAFAKTEGAEGIVSGTLTPAGAVDEEITRVLIQAARPLPFTFHRAFDHCREPLKALAGLKELGIQHLLTSGQAPTALDGISLLRELKRIAGEVSIMPGGGISPANIGQILTALQPQEIHFSGTRRVSSAMIHSSSIRMGAEDHTASKLVTDPVRLEKLISAVRYWEATHI